MRIYMGLTMHITIVAGELLEEKMLYNGGRFG